MGALPMSAIRSTPLHLFVVLLYEKKKRKGKKKERKREWNACLSRVGSTCGGAPSPTLPLDSLGPYDGRRIFLLGRQMFYHCLEMRARGKRGSGRRQKGASTAHSEHTPRLAQFCLFFFSLSPILFLVSTLWFPWNFSNGSFFFCKVLIILEQL